MLLPLLSVALLASLTAQDPQPPQPLGPPVPPTPQTTPAITAADLEGHIRVLSSDAFGGRGPGQAGDLLTVNYLKERFAAYGLEPAGTDGGWTQAVPMRELTPAQPPTASYDAGFGKQDLVFGRDAMLWSPTGTDPVSLENCELVFAGYGIVAPEYGWNDYEGLDVKGKTVVVLVNDPGYATGEAERFRGKSMTYYGRWTYKYEEAARQGAAGCLIVHEDGAAGYPWTVVVQSWGRGQLSLAGGDDGPVVPIQGWLSGPAAGELFAACKQDLAQLSRQASQPGFRAVPLSAGLTAFVQNTSRELRSDNVAAKVTGSRYPDETVIVCAHWDHLGTREGDGDEDRIYNGALDNATGTAALLELAEAIAAQPVKPERTILFLAVTAEEKGLLGSAYYARDPLVPLAKTVCGLNIDGLPVHGRTEDILVVGFGASELDQDLRLAALAQGRFVAPEASPEKGYYFRSDHFSLAKVGVPMLYTDNGVLHREKGEAYLRAKMADYLAKRYHRVGDEWQDDWELSGAVEDVRLFHALLAGWAHGQVWPQWAPDSEFRAAREESLRAAR